MILARLSFISSAVFNGQINRASGTVDTDASIRRVGIDPAAAPLLKHVVKTISQSEFLIADVL